MPKRAGTNFTDRNNIADYVNSGVTDAERIASNLNLEPGPVQTYVDMLTGKTKPKAKAKTTRKPRAAKAEDASEEQVGLFGSDVTTPGEGEDAA